MRWQDNCWEILYHFCHLLIFFKIKCFKNYFRSTIKVTNSLDPDQGQQFVRPVLGPICLRRLSADDNGR